MKRQGYSLRFRLLQSAALTLILFLGLTGIVLDQAFRQSAWQNVESTLTAQVYGLIAVADQQGELLYLPEAVQEPGFNRLGSGLFGLLLDSQGRELWRSQSAVVIDYSGLVDEIESATLGEPFFTHSKVPDVFVLSYKVLWQLGPQQSSEYTFVVLRNPDAYEDEVASFRGSLWFWLAVVVIGLTLVQWLVMRWGLAPLSRLADELRSLESREGSLLTGDYPTEIEGVTRNLNLLITAERAQREKYRTTLADLAHSLKTPLSILSNTTTRLSDQQEETAQLITDQVHRMNDLVSYQLERAVASASQIARQAVPVSSCAKRLEQALSKVYQAEQVDLSMVVGDETFYGDERDLMELLGNLLDNACKYGGGTVRLTVVGGEALRLIVEDDGPGIPKERHGSIMERGTRLDSETPGQGIGLAVVAEIVARYGGEVAIADAELGGAKFTVTLPL
ncbi:MAG: ATP-binding protein [Pseudomonadota bacterium]